MELLQKQTNIRVKMRSLTGLPWVPLLLLAVSGDSADVAQDTELFHINFTRSSSELRPVSMRVGVKLGEASGRKAAMTTKEFAEPPSKSIERTVIAFLERNRHFMTTGTRNVPRLDPLHVERVPEIKLGDLYGSSASLVLRNVYVRGASGYQIDALQIRINSRRADFTFTLPQLLIDTEYRINASVFSLTNYVAKGTARIRCMNVRVTGDAHADMVKPPGQKTHFVVNDLQLKIDIGAVTEVTATGLSNDASVNDEMNRLANRYGSIVADIMARDISHNVALIAMNEINKVLGQVRAIDIVTMLVPLESLLGAPLPLPQRQSSRAPSSAL